MQRAEASGSSHANAHIADLHRPRRANDFNGLELQALRRAELAALWLAVRAALGAKPVQWCGEMLTRAGHGFPEFSQARIPALSAGVASVLCPRKERSAATSAMPAKEWLVLF
jgi:hypothetical protein